MNYQQNDKILSKLTHILMVFTNFCFELDDENMIKGDNKFKY